MCAEESNQSSLCEHSDQERAFVGVYSAPELRTALAAGYSLLRVYESWLFDRSDCTLLREMIMHFLLVKIKASKLPTDDAERERHIKQVNDACGCKLTAEDFSFNPSLRCIAKIALNSMYVYTHTHTQCCWTTLLAAVALVGEGLYFGAIYGQPRF